MWFLGTLEGKFQKGHTQEGERLGGHIKVCPSQIFAELYTPSQATGGDNHGRTEKKTCVLVLRGTVAQGLCQGIAGKN